MAITKAGQSLADQAGLACSAIDVQLGSLSLELPAHSATYADYGHASDAGVPLDARVFNYYHRTSRGVPNHPQGRAEKHSVKGEGGAREAQPAPDDHQPRAPPVALGRPCGWRRFTLCRCVSGCP